MQDENAHKGGYTNSPDPHATNTVHHFTRSGLFKQDGKKVLPKKGQKTQRVEDNHQKDFEDVEIAKVNTEHGPQSPTIKSSPNSPKSKKRVLNKKPKK